MEGMTFDRITKRLGGDASRRRVLGGLIGGAAAVLTGGLALEAKAKNNGKGKANGRRKNGGSGQGGGQAGGAEKVQICHRNNGRKGYNLITVGAPAAAAHERHGDEVCAQQACAAVTGCDEDGACVYEDAAAGTECVTGDNLPGTCDNGGNCVADDDEDGTTG